MAGVEIPQSTRQAQALASDPARSAWVSANAGSGKTFVLARRVIRLLIAGVEPARILCLTFTKAAAAEMSNRVFASLSEWAIMPDEDLSAAFLDLEGRKAKPDDLNRARRLFTKALETPGGLKIQTIHAFAEKLLHQFPLEADVPAHFEVLDDQTGADLVNEALHSVLRRARLEEEGQWAKALSFLIEHMNDGVILDCLTWFVRNREDYARFIEASEQSAAAKGAIGLEAGLTCLTHTLGITADDNLEAIRAAIPFGPVFPRQDCVQLVNLLEEGGKRDKEQAILMRACLSAESTEQAEQSWLSFFRKKQDQSAKSLSFIASKSVQKSLPDLVDKIDQEQDRLDTLLDSLKAVETFDVSCALFTLADGIIGHYERAKANRGLMDFDDLIIKTADLLRPVNASAWVHYKLDQGIDHILVDEAQDTNPRQWEIIQQLSEEFFTGEGARLQTRTLFAVGDEKQSIYSFQGARPKWFAEMREYFAKRAKEAKKPFERINLHLSFRSTPHVLKAVDSIFSIHETFDALSADKVQTVHEAIRRHDPGLVEIWPLLEPAEEKQDRKWFEPLDVIGNESPPVQLAQLIASTIRHWIDNGAIIEGKGRVITPGDILVLVRKRGTFVEAVNRALKEEGLPVAGADRLALLEHIAIMDLLALGDVMLLPEDDMTLAIVLQSPLFGLSQERLFDLAHIEDEEESRKPGRGQKALWEALRLRAESGVAEDADFAAIYDQLVQWRSKIDFQPPFDFYAQLLGPGGRRAAFTQRLGPETDEVIDEFLSRALEFERSQTPNLQLFLSAMRAGGAEIKRDMGAANDQIRVMTVHGAKGLEAPIVFLVDGTGKPSDAHHQPNLVHLPAERGSADLLVWKAGKEKRPEKITQALSGYDRTQEDEYLRLLYVGMTRAEDRLYLCGYRGKNKAAENCWYQVAQRILCGQSQEVPHPLTGESVLRWQFDGDFTAKPTRSDEKDSDSASEEISPPDWFFKIADTKSTKIPVLQPSKASDRVEGQDDEENRGHVLAVLPSRGAGFDWEPRRRGLVLHTLFEHLPNLAKTKRFEAGMAYLQKVAPDMGDAAQTALLQEALDLLCRPEYASLFGPNSQAEISLAGFIRLGEVEHQVSGQIDRLCVREDEIIIVDYKTNRLIPPDNAHIPFEYQTQMALYAHLLKPLYPGRHIKCLILWTAGPVIMAVSEAQMLDALTRIGFSA